MNHSVGRERQVITNRRRAKRTTDSQTWCPQAIGKQRSSCFAATVAVATINFLLRIP